MIFRDRKHAGELLAERVAALRGLHPIVLALPRGGLPVAREVAKKLECQLDVLVVRKIGSPHNPEFGIGAVTEEGFYWINEVTAAWTKDSAWKIKKDLSRKQEEVKEKAELYRKGRPLTRLRGKTVILVDDGLATGVSAQAAVRYVQSKNPSRLILAVPVGAQETVRSFQNSGIEVVCLSQPTDLFSVSQWYQDFDQTDDQEVLAILRSGSHLEVEMNIDGVVLEGNLTVPDQSRSLVLFAHGSGSSRNSPRNQSVARTLNRYGIGTLLFDLLSDQETLSQDTRASYVFDIERLAKRLVLATKWMENYCKVHSLPRFQLGYFGASTGAAAALWAASLPEASVQAIVCRGGRPDLALDRLKNVPTPCLLIVGGEDTPVLGYNHLALRKLHEAGNRHSEMRVIPQASHLFEEPGALEKVAQFAVSWFQEWLPEQCEKKIA